MSHHTVLVVGVTGNSASLGKEVVDYLLTKKSATIHILTRKEKRANVSHWESQGVKVFEGDLMDIESLRPAVKGVDTVVSCVQGGPDVLVGGQTNLLKVSVEAGVKRFYPSDYSVDMRRVPDDSNVNCYIRKQFHQVLEEHKMNFVTVFCGVFMDVIHGIGYNFLKLSYPDQKKIEVYGDEFTLINTTTVRNTAHYTVESIFDPNAPKYLCIAGETITIFGWKKILEQVTGETFTLEHGCSAEELTTQWKHEMQTQGPNGWAVWIPKMYKANLYKGEGFLVQNHVEKYPAVKPVTIAEYVKMNLGGYKKQ